MLSHRRRTLLTLASYGTWDFDLTSFPYVYNSLLTKGSEVVKGKISKIYANGVIENQLVQNGNFADTSVWGGSTTIFSVNNNVGELSGSGDIRQTINLVSGHKYLAVVELYGQTSNQMLFVQNLGNSRHSNTSTDTWETLTLFIDNNLTSASFRVINNESLACKFRNYRCVDLTQMFGTGNEPTTLTDNRIQNLLNRGYIAYNTGEYKGTNVSEIATEPYNLFDGELEIGSLNNGQPVSNNQFLRTINYISVLGGTPYSIGTNMSPFNRFFIEEYDENKVFLGEGTANNNSSFTTKQNTRYFKFLIYGGGSSYSDVPTNDTYFSRTGTRTGYAKHKPSASIPFIYQGNGALNAHDTFEITSSEYVFTKNVSSYTFTGSESWDVTNSAFNISFVQGQKRPDSSSSVAQNAIASNGMVFDSQIRVTNGLVDNAIAFRNNADVLYARIDNSITTVSAMASAMAGRKITYELATPQVIRIPRKHLGIVRIRDLSWTYKSNNGTMQADISNAQYSGGYYQISNIYCSQYLTVSAGVIEGGSPIDKSIGLEGNGLKIRIKDNLYSDATNFVNDNGDYYIFYETADEVTDIATRIFTENGGTVSALEPRLPKEYQEVEYIESSGTQCIDCDILTSYDLEIEADIAITEEPSQGYKSLFGNISSWVMNFVIDNDGIRWVGEAPKKFESNYTVNEKFNVKVGYDYCKINGVSVPSSSDNNGVTYGNIYIGRAYSPTFGKARYYKFKIKSNSILARNFVPCYRKTDNVIGLYDLVGKQFYTNTGTGTFAKGSDVNTTDYCEVLPNLDLDLPIKV